MLNFLYYGIIEELFDFFEVINLKKLLLVGLAVLFFLNNTSVKAETNSDASIEDLEIVKIMEFDVNDVSKKTVVAEIVYEDLTFDELTTKLNKSLSSTLTNKGAVFASNSLKYGVDPYLALAIVLHETGCKWGCSSLVVNCNNVGGVKGSPSCGGGSYRYYSSLDAGIEAFIRNLKYNYYDYGLNTASKMQRKYTGGSTTWALKVENYIIEIKSK